MSSAASEVTFTCGWRRWFAFLGGGFAWTCHLLSIYAIGEFGCVSGAGDIFYMGISVVAWLILVLSFLLFAVAASASLVGYLDTRRARLEENFRPEEEGGRFLSSFGFMLSALFALIILVESLPVFAYLDGC